jgi:hypothetical protein
MLAVLPDFFRPAFFTAVIRITPVSNQSAPHRL